MTWSEKINNGIIITTGDGKEFRPLYVIAPKKYDFNISEFEFPEIEGTLVVRKKKKGTRHTLELYFQGENHLDEIQDFENSANDERPWKVYFPFYGNKLVQPVSINFDTTGINNSKVTCELVETITDEYPRVRINSTTKVSYDVDDVNSKLVDSFVNNSDLTTKDLNRIASDTSILKSSAEKIKKTSEQSTEYTNLFNQVNSSILYGIAGVSYIGTSVNNFISYPANFSDSIEARLSLLKSQFIDLSGSISNLISPTSKVIYEFQAGSILTAIINSLLNPLGALFTNTSQVLSVIDLVASVFNLYIQNLDFLQTLNGYQIDSYVPNYTSISALSDLVDYLISQLFNITLTTKQERSVILEYNSNAILLAHRFYGLDSSDSTINSFIEQNNIGINELLNIPAGRKIIYYV